MARRKVNYEHLCRNLIKLVCDIQDETSDDFKECYSYSISNFKYHRFLSVDSHKVNQKIDGLCEKFAVHSQEDKAKALRELTTKFLGLPLFDQKMFDHSDTHYSILSLLIELANSPTGSSSYESSKSITVEEDKDFDWAAYLREGEDVYYGSYSSSSEFSDLDEDDDDDGIDYIREADETEIKDSEQMVPVESSLKDLNISKNPSECQTQPEKANILGYEWLSKNIITSYWNGTPQNIPENSNYYNIVKEWELYDDRSYPFKNKQTVTESQIIREIIWMLLGTSDTFIFQYTGTNYRLRENIRLTHLSQIALENNVDIFLKAGALILELMSFIDSVSEKPVNIQESKETNSLTYEAFAFSIDQFVHEYKSVLCKLEQNVQKQKTAITILILQKHLEPWIGKLTLVYNIYVNGVQKFKSVESSSEKAAALLSCLYDKVMELHLMNQTNLLSVAFPLWINTIRPYINIIDEWITTGQLQDFHKEFIIQRSQIPLTLDETSWEQSLVIKFSNTNSQSPVPESEVKDDAMSSFSEVAYVIHDWTPHFLNTILEPIIRAGKSMDVFNTLDCLNTLLIKQNPLQYQNSKSLFEMFLTCLNDYLDKESNCGSQDVLPLINTNDTIHLEFPIKKVLDDQCNPLLQINLDSLFKKGLKTSSPQFDVRETTKCLMSSWKSIQPIEHVMEHCLYPLIRDKCLWICRQVVQSIITDHHVWDYLTAMRNFFLMEAGETMFEFYTKLFYSMQHQLESHVNVAFLNRALRQALEKNFPDEIGKLSVFVQKLPRPPTIDADMQLNDTDCINLAYAIPWPVNMIINSKSVTKYNQIFKMLLKIKRVKFSLDTLRFDELEKVQGNRKELTSSQEALRKETIHRFHILRMRLLYFTNTLNSHIMHQIVHSREFLNSLNTSVDLDEMLTCHEEYLEQILQYCFLVKKSSVFSGLLEQILSIALRLSNHWKKGVDKISLETLAAMEENFTKWIPFLQCCSAVKITVERDSHLEHLLSSLTMSCSV
ncbi:gamma-tubulin complex component 5-like isoform X1 [Octopus vulgaris]|uniref:Gamma-tubulin complex component n=1 Tax=Octopus vulgaris TaxID=6645 RepID=A0AA36BU17_OCTVU|nr:gamma-tubulin complex component 5-like isoform X1 [Octopus vulgaris]